MPKRRATSKTNPTKPLKQSPPSSVAKQVDAALATLKRLLFIGRITNPAG